MNPKRILITGGAGFLGQRLGQALLSSDPRIERLVLADLVQPRRWTDDSRLQAVQADITRRESAESLLADGIDAICHLAAVVSAEAESDFDLGMGVNLDGTRNLLEAARASGGRPRFLFTSSLAVYGAPLPKIVAEDTPARPRSSYGMEKAVAELWVGEYTRRDFVDGWIPRLPTIAVRPGKPNRAASSFASGIIREPLNGESAVCPVGRDLVLWLSSPETAVGNLVHGLRLPGEAFGENRVLNLPGLSVTAGDMVASLGRVCGPAVAGRVVFQPEEAVSRIVADWPGCFDVGRALGLGFRRDESFDTVIRRYLAERETSAGQGGKT
jgi:D-erythronate 2-dehydrogenase